MRRPPGALESARGGLMTQARYGNAVPARAARGLRAKFERQADPDGTLPDAERHRRADMLMRAHMLKLAAASARARRAA